MRIGRKLMVVLSVLVTGASTAFFFRRDGRDAWNNQATTGPFRERVERRVTAGAAWARKINQQQALQSRAATTAAIEQPAETTTAQPAFHKSVNPVASLLPPVDGIAPEVENASTPPSVTDPAADLPVTPATHRVQDGDTLTRLAVQYLGRADRYLEIFEYNRDVLSNPDLLPIGATIRIPPNQSRDKLVPSPAGETTLPLVPVRIDNRPR
jgi:nucleoid-associated protein YgaU